MYDSGWVCPSPTSSYGQNLLCGSAYHARSSCYRRRHRKGANHSRSHTNHLSARCRRRGPLGNNFGRWNSYSVRRLSKWTGSSRPIAPRSSPSGSRCRDHCYPNHFFDGREVHSTSRPSIWYGNDAASSSCRSAWSRRPAASGGTLRGSKNRSTGFASPTLSGSRLSRSS